ncbi:MAG TPA: DUF87 domain-containing protein [Gemmatimonadaceae bacterium]|nr:DUF87 domain-containing protein [Gemmatimonadaceae bacterium]
MTSYEKLGSFYLGRERDGASGKTTDTPTLYDSSDLTTHAVIIGMTGSGKTGLGIDIIEEAAVDKVPVIAIDPKGDLANLLLTFPELRPEDFRPWIDVQAAERAGLSPDAFAAGEAEKWRRGLEAWDERPERITLLRESADFVIFTPGSSAGVPISVLRSFAAPSSEARSRTDRYLEHVEATATSLLALLGIDADPLTSREHILIANLLRNAWDAGKDLDLQSLILGIQQPPFAKLGVMDIESAFPSADRAKLAMRLNNLLASPGFEAWRERVPLDAQRLFYTDAGKPRVAVISIAHLSDAERMFFVTMLLTNIVEWMRAQPGTGSLRALLYMDEVAGYLPPVANPPSKQLFLSLLKQARAFGVGVVLATQNPVDLDYKGISNAGTWLIGRLQTERDKARVMDGLEGAAAGGGSAGGFDRKATETLISGLDKRVFYLHNVHEDDPTIFETRWAMSYLAGPMTRDQIRRLMAGKREELLGAEARAGEAAAARAGASSAAAAAAPGATAAVASTPADAARSRSAAGADARPVLPGRVEQFFVPLPASGDKPVYHAGALGAADIVLTSAKYGVNSTRRVLHRTAICDGALPVDWEEAEELKLDPNDLEREPLPGASFAPCPAVVTEQGVESWRNLYERWLRTSQAVTLFRSPTFKLVSEPGESEGAFRARLQLRAREERNAGVEELRKKYAVKNATLQERLARAEQRVNREQGQAGSAKMDAFVAAGTAVLGMLLGRKRASVTAASRVGTAIRRAGLSYDQAGDVTRAEESAERVRQQIAELEDELQSEITALGGSYDAQKEELEPVHIRPRRSDVQVHFVGVGWGDEA